MRGVEVAPRDVVAAALPDPATLGDRMTGRTCAGTLVTGTGKDGKPRATYLYHVADNETTMREDGHQAVVWQTAVNPVVAMELLAEGAWTGTGVLGPEAFDAVPFLDLLADYGAPHGVDERDPADPLTRTEEHLSRLEQLRVQQLRRLERLVERHELDLGAPQRGHHPEVAGLDRVDRRHAEAGAEHAVVGQRRAAALHVAEDRHARLEAGARLDLALELDRDPAQAHVAERVRALVLAPGAALLRRRPLRDDDDRERRAVGLAVAQPLADLVEVERALGHEDHVGAARHPRVAGDPAGVAAHHLDHDHAVVRLGGGVQPVDRVGGDLHRGLEAEGEVGAREVVVDRLRHADDVDAVLDQPAGDPERVLAADRDQRVDALLAQRRAHLLEPALLLVRVRPRRTEDGAAAVQDPARALVGQLDRLAR